MSVLRHLPNLITFLRMLLVVPLCWLIGDGRYGGALAIAAIAGFSDALDGWLAKRFGWRSWLGGMLDPIADKLLLTAAFLWLALAGDVPGWIAWLVIGRDVVIVAGAIAYASLIGRFDAEPTRLSKLTTLVQIVFVLGALVALAGIVDIAPPVAALALFATAALTLASGVDYIVSWSRRARGAAREGARR